MFNSHYLEQFLSNRTSLDRHSDLSSLRNRAIRAARKGNCRSLLHPQLPLFIEGEKTFFHVIKMLQLRVWAEALNLTNYIRSSACFL